MLRRARGPLGAVTITKKQAYERVERSESADVPGSEYVERVAKTEAYPRSS